MDSEFDEAVKQYRARYVRIHEIADKYRSLMEYDTMDHIHICVDAGEPAIALEDLCAQIDEFDIVIDRADHDDLKRLGEEMRVDPRYWERLTVREEGEHQAPEH